MDVREDFELRGLVNCYYCGKKYTGAPSKSHTGQKHNYYKCNNKSCSFYGKSIKSSDLHSKFHKLLKDIKANKNVVNLALEVLNDVWKVEKKNIFLTQEKVGFEKVEIENNISKFALASVNADNNVLKAQYEKEVEKLSKKLEEIEPILSSTLNYEIPCRTSQEQVKKALENPYSIWKGYNVYQKQRFYNFIFEGNLVYDKNSGYRTPGYSLPIRIFQEIDRSKPNEVEMAGIEPASKKQA